MMENSGSLPNYVDPNEPKFDPKAPSPLVDHNTIEVDMELSNSIKVPIPTTIEDPGPKDPTVEDLSPALRVMLPPIAKDGQMSLPGYWEDPDGYGQVVSGTDCFFWAFWWFWRFKRPEFLKCLIIIGLQGLVAYYNPLVIKKLLSTLDLRQNKAEQEFLFYLVISGALEFASGVLDHRLMLFSPAGGGFRPVTMGRMVYHFLNLPLDQSEDVVAGKITPIIQGLGEIDKNINAMINLISAGTIFTLSVVAFLQFSVDLIFLQMCCFVTMAVYILKTSDKLSKDSEGLESQMRSFYQVAEELLNLRVSISFLNLKKFADQKITKAQASLQSGFKNLKLTNLKQLLYLDTLSSVAAVIIIGYGGMRVRNQNSLFGKTLHLGELVTFFAFHAKLLKVFLKVIKCSRTMQISAAYIKTISKVLHNRSLKFSESESKQSNKAEWGRVQVKDVDFSYKMEFAMKGYEEKEKLKSEPVSVLHGVSVDIPPGCKVAVVGRSGAGKSTLLKLLARGYTADSGVIKLGGEYISQVDMSSRVAVVEQQAPLFDATVMENIRIGRDGENEKEGISDERCKAAAKKACLTGMVDSMWSLPQGMQTPCGPQGRNLNGGIAQRVMVARALARNAPIVIMDEPMSSQDELIRGVLVENITNLKHTVDGEEFDTTVICATQHLDTLVNFDKILYIQNGEKRDFGTLKELEASKGPFFQFRFRNSLVKVNMYGEASITASGLSRVWPLAEVPAAELTNHVASIFVTQTFQPGAVIQLQGEATRACFVVASGECAQYFNISGNWGGAPVPKGPGNGEVGSANYGIKVRELVAGDCASTGALYCHLDSIEDRPLSNLYTVVAKSRCKLLMVSNMAIQDLYQEQPQIQAQVTRTVKNRDQGCLDALNKIWQLVTLDANQLHALAKLAEMEIPPPDEVFYNMRPTGEYDPPSPPCCYIVLSGMVSLTILNKDTGDSLQKTASMGEHFGMERLLGEEERREYLLSARAMGDVELLCIREGLFQAFKELPTFNKALKEVATCLDTHRDPKRLLNQSWPLGGMPHTDLQNLLAHCKPEVYRQGDFVLTSYNKTADIFFVAFGSVDLVLKTSEGDHVTQTVGPGGAFNQERHMPCRFPYEMLHVTCSENCIALRAPSHLVHQSQEYMKFFLPEWTQNWEKGLAFQDPDDQVGRRNPGQDVEMTCLANQLNIKRTEARLLSTLASFNLTRLKRGEVVEDFKLTASDPQLILLVVFGTVDYKTGFVEHEGEVGQVLMNTNAATFLRDRQLDSIGDNLIKAHEVVAGDHVKVSSEWSLVCVVELQDALSPGTLERSLTLRRDVEDQEGRRFELLNKAQRVQREVVESERRLGWCPRFHSARRAFRLARLLIMAGKESYHRKSFHQGEGQVINPRKYDPMWTLMRESTSADLTKAIKFYEEKLAFMEPQIHKNIIRLEVLKSEWARIGLKLERSDGPDGTDDISEKRILRIERLIEERKEHFKTNREHAKRDFHMLGQVLDVPQDEWHKMVSTLDREKGVNALIKMEVQNDLLRDKAIPIAEGLGLSINQLYENLQIPDDRRVKLRDDWTATELFLFHKMEGALRSSQRFALKKLEENNNVCRKMLVQKEKEIQILKKMLKEKS